MSTHRLRAQINSLDFMMALFIFVVLFIFTIMFWSANVIEAKSAMGDGRMGFAAIAASDLMVRSQGYPTNWESRPSAIQMIGLASSPNSLSRSKLSSFTNSTLFPYNQSKALVGTTGDYYMYVEDMNGSRLFEKGNSSAVSESRATVTRFGVLDGQKVRLVLTLYG